MITKTITALLSISLLFLASCDVFDSTEDDPLMDQERKLSRQLTAQEQMAVDGSNDFAFLLLHQLQEKEEGASFFVSPFSITSAFGMTLNGAEGSTYEQMRDFFGYDGLTRDEINEAYRDLVELLVELDPQVALNIANSIWIRENFDVKQDFIDTNRDYYNAEVRELDFAKEEAPDIINGWIEEETEGMIDEMIDEIGPDVVMYLINAIYFQGDWTIQFDPEQTNDRPFHLEDGETTEVPLMSARDNFRHYFGDDWTALDMWYGDAGYSFTALKPAGDNSLEEQISTFTDEDFETITENLTSDTVNVYVPKFELNYEIDNFKDELKDMGLTEPFSLRGADFSGINEDEPLAISNVLHEAVIELDEEGSEAAAATVIEMIREVSVGGDSTPTIRLDQPFLFFIRENTTNTILFMGVFTGK